MPCLQGNCKLKHSRDVKSFYEAREQQQHSGTKGTTEGQNKSYQSARAPFIIKDSPDSETWSRPFSSKYLQVLDLVRDSVTEALEEKTCTPGASVHELRAQTWCCYSTAWKSTWLVLRSIFGLQLSDPADTFVPWRCPLLLSELWTPILQTQPEGSTQHAEAWACTSTSAHGRAHRERHLHWNRQRG